MRDAVVFIGIAQEKAYAFSAHRLPGKRAVFEFTRNKSVIPNYYYFYLDDADWGESLIKVCSYAPWGMKLYLNGHEWLKRQLAKEGIAFKELDNGFLSCDNPQRLQALAQTLAPQRIQAFLNKWVDRLPLPLSAADRKASVTYSNVSPDPGGLQGHITTGSTRRATCPGGRPQRSGVHVRNEQIRDVVRQQRVVDH